MVTPARALLTVVPEEQQAAEVKVEAFPSTKYGLIHGTIVALSPAKDRTVRLTPGMAVQADVKTDERRVIDNLLGPVMKAEDENAESAGAWAAFSYPGLITSSLD